MLLVHVLYAASGFTLGAAASVLGAAAGGGVCCALSSTWTSAVGAPNAPFLFLLWMIVGAASGLAGGTVTGWACVVNETPVALGTALTAALWSAVANLAATALFNRLW